MEVYDDVDDDDGKRGKIAPITHFSSYYTSVYTTPSTALIAPKPIGWVGALYERINETTTSGELSIYSHIHFRAYFSPFFLVHLLLGTQHNRGTPGIREPKYTIGKRTSGSEW